MLTQKMSKESLLVALNVDKDKNLANLKSEVAENESPLNKIIYASFYEENGLILDALTKYEEAIEMYPEIEDFQETIASKYRNYCFQILLSRC